MAKKITGQKTKPGAMEVRIGKKPGYKPKPDVPGLSVGGGGFTPKPVVAPNKVGKASPAPKAASTKKRVPKGVTMQPAPKPKQAKTISGRQTRTMR